MDFLLKKKDFGTILNIGVIFIVITNNILAQSSDVFFSKFSKEQGLSNILINTISQDKQGFLWIGTWDGLNRFDGYQFKVYKPVESDPAALSNGIQYAAEDENDRIWIVSPTGLNIFYKTISRFKNIYTITHDNFTCMLIDSKGTLWLGTYSEGVWTLPVNNIFDFSKIKTRFKRYEHDNNDPNSVSSNLVLGIFEDKQSNIWINASNKIFDLYDPKTGSFEHYSINIPDIEKQTTVKMKLKDTDGLYWFCTYGAGLFSWDRAHNVFKQFLNEPKKNSLSANIVTDIRQTKDGILWISTDGGGISLYDKKTGLFESFKSDITNPNSLSSNAINATLEDRSGVTWVATRNMGLNKYEADKKNLGLHTSNPFDKNSLNNKAVTSIIEDKNGKIWIATDGGGLNYWDKTTGKFSYFVNDPYNQNSISGNAAVCLTEDFEGNIWIGTYAKGLNCYQRKEGKFIHYTFDPNDNCSISHNNVWALLEDHKHNLWVAALEGTLNLFNRKTNRFYHYKNDPNDPNSFIEKYTTNLFEDSRHYLWIATGSGLEMVKLDDYDFNKPFPKLKFNHYRHEKDSNSLNNSNVYCISEDHEGNMWFGTDGSGLNKLNIKTNKFTAFTMKDGLPDNSIKAILEDNDYNLWISTTNGLSKFNPKTRSFHNYDFTDGLQDYAFSNAHCKSKDDRLLFGGSNGFNIFDPRSFRTNNNPPQVVITDFKVYNSSVAVGQEIDGNIILKKSIFKTDTIILSHKVNIFAIEFAALDFTNPEKNKYAYKMEGFDSQWQNTNAKNRIATYTNLDPGTYTFRVRASNNDGIWNKRGTSMCIIILPPFWKTTWFKLLVLLIFISSIYLAYYLRVEMYRKKEKELTVLVRQRTQEISKANNILLEKQTRIEEYAEELRTHTENLSEANQQLAVLNSTKDRFFSIIAHDLRNPFHTVSGFAEILINDYKKLSPEKIERFLNLIYSSSISGNNLLENLLQWSRSQTGRISFTPAKLNLSAIADETISLLEGNARSKNITIQTLIDQNITVLADENMLKTICRNLVSNAIKFTSENGTVTIKAATSNLQVEVTIADTGVGIPQENLSQLFRIDATVTTKGTASEAGTGLGLILCKEFIEKHKGKIWVESDEGKGSQFKFTLPLF